MGDRRIHRGSRRLAVLAVASLALTVTACGDEAKPAAQPAATPTPTAIAAGQYVQNAKDFVDAANWDAATKVNIKLGEMYFEPKQISLKAGSPYVLELVNVGKLKHEFVSGDFFRSAAFRKAEDDSAEVKVPFFTETEVLAGKTVELYDRVQRTAGLPT